MSVMVVYFYFGFKSGHSSYHQNIESRNERFGLNVFIFILEKPWVKYPSLRHQRMSECNR